GTEAVFQKALAISPRDRFRTAGEFWTALRKAVFPAEQTWLPPSQRGDSLSLSPAMPGGPMGGPQQYGQTGPRTPPGTQGYAGYGGQTGQSNPPGVGATVITNPTNVALAGPAVQVKKSGGGSVGLIAAIGVLVLGGGAAGVYFGVIKKGATPPPTS